MIELEKIEGIYLYQGTTDMRRGMHSLLERPRIAFLADYPEDSRKERRQMEVKPSVEKYFELAAEYRGEDDTPRNRAISYGLDEVSHYLLFLEDGSVPMTNNSAERAVRKVKMVKNASMFSKTEGGAGDTAVMLSVVQTAVLNGLNPRRYMEYVLTNHKDLSDPEKERKRRWRRNGMRRKKERSPTRAERSPDSFFLSKFPHPNFRLRCNLSL